MKKEFQYYIDFRFKTSIQDTFYKGNALMSKDFMENIAGVLDGNNKDTDVFPTLKKQIESFMIEGKFKYDGWEFGYNDFGLYWAISESCFFEVVKKLVPYLKYMELENEFETCWIHDKEKDLDCLFTFSTLTEYSNQGNLEKWLEPYMTYEERQKLKLFTLNKYSS